MRQLSICIRKVSFRVFRRVLWLIPVFVILSWNPSLPYLVKTIESAELPENHSQKQPAAKDSQVNLHELSVKGSLPQFRVIDYDETGGFLYESQMKYDFSQKSKREIDIFQKKSHEFDNLCVSSNLVSKQNDKQLDIFRLKQQSNNFYYGIEYRYVGKDLKNPKDYKKKTDTETNLDLESDQEAMEIWIGREVGPIHLRTFSSRFWDNVAGEPNLPRMLTNKSGVSMKYKLPALPLYLSTGHSQSQSRSTSEPDCSETKGSYVESFDSSLYYYGGKMFDMTLCSSYSIKQDRVRPVEETQIFWHQISTSIRPIWKITITPSVSFGEYRYLWYDERTENPSASLSISYYRLFDAVDLSLWGSYSQMKGTDGYQDNSTYNSSVALSWYGRHLSLPKITYSFWFGYDAYVDEIYPDSSYQNLSFSFGLKTLF